MAVLDGLGLERVVDRATGIALRLPTKVVDFARYAPPFAHFDPVGDLDARVLLISQSGDRTTLNGLYDVMQTLEIVPETGPRSLERDGFTWSARARWRFRTRGSGYGMETSRALP